jgi:hypothetical protein
MTASRGRVGDAGPSVELKIPMRPRGGHFPGFPEPRRTAEKALVAVIQEAHVQGIFTSSVGELVKVLRDDRHDQEPGLAPARRGRRARQCISVVRDRVRLGYRFSMPSQFLIFSTTRGSTTTCH